jgi:CRISPR/Cas system-associated exonuclease Cas4 (RecB family)
VKRTPSPRMIQKLVNGLSRRQDSGRTGIHVSDLTLCLRKVYYSRTSPREATPETLGYYVDGSRRDFVIKGLLGPKVDPREKDGIWFTPDSIDEAGNPIEIKTTRASEGIASHYVTQLAYYMVLMVKSKGRLVIQRVGFRRSDMPFEAYDFEFEDGEMERYRQEMINKKDALKGALDERDSGRVPSVRYDSEYNWLCKTCPWNRECWEVEEQTHLQRKTKEDVN